MLITKRLAVPIEVHATPGMLVVPRGTARFAFVTMKRNVKQCIQAAMFGLPAWLTGDCVLDEAREIGGSLRAQSDGPDRGATFTLLLPQRPPGYSP